MRQSRSISLALLAMLTSPVVVSADEWVVNRLRGQAERYDGQQWHPLRIGDVVESSRHVRTLHRSRMELVHGDEVLELAPATFLAIHEATGRKMTTVEQSLGSVTVQVDKRDVQHFQVQTPMLAAVVKGTQFSVTIKNGQTEVDVRSGMVEVEDAANDISANVVAGQSAVSSDNGGLQVTGPGASDTIYLVRGVPVSARQMEQVTGLRLNTEVALATPPSLTTVSESQSSPNPAPVVQVPTPPGPVIVPPQPPLTDVGNEETDGGDEQEDENGEGDGGGDEEDENGGGGESDGGDDGGDDGDGEEGESDGDDEGDDEGDD